MNTLVKFTNYAEPYKGMPLYIAIENIMSVYEIATDEGSLVTCIYGMTHDTWNVEEGLNEVIAIVNGWKL
jgi:hypothetical protein